MWLPTIQKPHKLLEMYEVRNKGLISASDFSPAFMQVNIFIYYGFGCQLFVPFFLLTVLFLFQLLGMTYLCLFMPKATGFDLSSFLQYLTKGCHISTEAYVL